MSWMHNSPRHHAAALLALLLSFSTLAGAAFTHLGTDFTYWTAYQDTPLTTTLADLQAAGLNVAYMDVKTEDGVLGYLSNNPTAISLGANGGWTSPDPLARWVSAAHASNIKAGVRFIVGQDAKYAAAHQAASLSTQWVDISDPGYQQYLRELVAEIAGRGVDEINLDFIRFPDTGEAANYTYSSTKPKAQVIDELANSLSTAARGAKPGITVSASVFGRICDADNRVNGDPKIGQRLTIANQVDFIAPMLYPTYLPSPYTNQPYEGVRHYTECFVTNTPGGASKVKPWIQAFDAIAQDQNAILGQMRGVSDGGGTGYLLWWAASIGTGSATWAKIRFASNTPTPSPSPTAAPAPAQTPTTTTPSATPTVLPAPSQAYTYPAVTPQATQTTSTPTPTPEPTRIPTLAPSPQTTSTQTTLPLPTKTSGKADACERDSDCDDGYACTADSCTGQPRHCTYQVIPRCGEPQSPLDAISSFLGGIIRFLGDLFGR